jgi:hypothetical protein
MIAEISRLHAAVPIRSSQVAPLGGVLTRAFYNNPGVTYVLPDPDVRRSVLSWFFTSVALRASRLCGEIYTTVNVDGGALWICPGANLTVGHVVRAEISSLPQRLDRSILARWINVNTRLDSIRHHLVDKLHWHLIALGTGPSTDRAVVAKALMAPVLASADWDLRSCYVETFQEGDLPFYERCGFQIAGAGQIPKGGPSFWTLIRPPRPR